jgi:hypothetical protein
VSVEHDRAVDEAAVARIVAELQADPIVVSALWVGSRSRGEGIGHSSDLDILAHIREDAGPKFRRGCVDHESGRHVELLFRPASLDRAKFATSTATGDGWLHGFVHGRVLFDRDGTLRELMREARERWEAGPDALPPSEREWQRYQLAMDLPDIRDRIETMPAVASFLLSALAQELFRFIYRLERWWWPPAKYLLDDLRTRDAELAGLFARIFGPGMLRDRLQGLEDGFHVISERFDIDFQAPYASASATRAPTETPSRE